ncbi:MAG: hypothetical protein NT174_06830 [Actinobacteria bacterium]|nr:hypothetical protein [Actinomycetota bacterium]
MSHTPSFHDTTLWDPQVKELAVLVTDLCNRTRVKLVSANLLPGRIDGFAIGLSGNSNPSTWFIPK